MCYISFEHTSSLQYACLQVLMIYMFIRESSSFKVLFFHPRQGLPVLVKTSLYSEVSNSMVLDAIIDTRSGSSIIPLVLSLRCLSLHRLRNHALEPRLHGQLLGVSNEINAEALIIISTRSYHSTFTQALILTSPALWPCQTLDPINIQIILRNKAQADTSPIAHERKSGNILLGP